MNNEINIQEELLSISPAVAAISRANVFSVPDDYFNSLSTNILAGLKPAEINFAGIPKQSFSVPDGYFDGLADSIMSKIKAAVNETAAEELASLSPALAAIGNKNIFTVPPNYFEETPGNILQQLPQPAKVVSIGKRSFFSRYAVAAAITGVIGLSVISVLDKKSSTDKSLFASQETKTAMQYANTIIKNNSFDAELNSISDKDIQQYLEAHGQDVDAALVASASDDSNLPSPEDYIINDNTLDNYLKQANLNN